jgi:hypothetical protein
MVMIAMPVEVKFRQVTCPVCQTKFTTASERRRFCSRKCREQYWSAASKEKLLADPERKRKSLQRLFAWKEAHKNRKRARAHETVRERDTELGGERNGV